MEYISITDPPRKFSYTQNDQMVRGQSSLSAKKQLDWGKYERFLSMGALGSTRGGLNFEEALQSSDQALALFERRERVSPMAYFANGSLTGLFLGT